MALAFLSYRREDTVHAAQAIYLQMKVRFGSGQLFMDLNSMPGGVAWPSHIQQTLEKSSGMLVLCGPRWLHAADEWGRRRLDLSDDWVFLEIKRAVERSLPIIPVMVGEHTVEPPPHALPPAICQLMTMQVHRVRPSSWMRDVDALAELCKAHFGLKERADLKNVVPPYPTRQDTPPVDPQRLSSFLAESGWEAWEDTLPREYPLPRQELTKNFIFDSFLEAAAFMYRAADLFQQEDHHPRWSNEWRLVTIRLTTWDAKNRITDIDLDVAVKVDQLYRSFREQCARSAARDPR